MADDWFAGLSARLADYGLKGLDMTLSLLTIQTIMKFDMRRVLISWQGTRLLVSDSSYENRVPIFMMEWDR